MRQPWVIVAQPLHGSIRENALMSAIVTPELWLRYVDDTFVLWPHRESWLEEFHWHLNSQHPRIQFTKEMELDNQISFLDVLVERDIGTYGSAPILTDIYTSPHITTPL